MSESTANFVQTLGEGIHVKQRPANDLKGVGSFLCVGEAAIASQLGVASHVLEGLVGGIGLLRITEALRPVLVEALEDFIRSRVTQGEMLRLRREMKAEPPPAWVATTSTLDLTAPAPKKPKSQRGSSRRGTGR